MGFLFLSILLCGLGLLFTGSMAQAPVVVTVSATASHSIPTTLWGLMFEDISHSGDGGLYAEMLQNRAFQQVTPNTTNALNAWQANDGASISVVADPDPVSSAIPNALQLSIPSTTTTALSFANTGFWGIKVIPQTYKTSFYVRVANDGGVRDGFRVTVSLVSSGGHTLVSHSVNVPSSQKSFKQINANLKPTTSAPDTNNTFVISVKPLSAPTSDAALNFGLFSLFPPTFKNRPNGMRADIAQTLADIKPGFWRFPGGNNLEGQTIATRWQWNATVGPLEDRPGRLGDWGYINTDGLGLLEYLIWCEDLNMEPIMAIWDGFALGGQVVTGDALQPYIQQAMDQINFVVGDPADSKPAALRASLGHPEPFKLNFVEVGNEDFLGNPAPTLANRWSTMVPPLQAAFPQLKFIATGTFNSPVLNPKAEVYDVHQYQTPTFFWQTETGLFDAMPRDGTLFFMGEYASTSNNASNIFGTPDQGRLLFPSVNGAVGEAAFMTSMERNADIVFAASYAPLLGHVNNSQWTPNLVGFDAGQVIKSASYYTQQLFSLNKGDAYLPSTLPGNHSSLNWSVVEDSKANTIIVKISNANATAAVPMAFELPFRVAKTAHLTTLTGSPNAMNTPEQPDLIAPTTSTVTVGSTFNITVPAMSFNVLVLRRS